MKQEKIEALVLDHQMLQEVGLPHRGENRDQEGDSSHFTTECKGKHYYHQSPSLGGRLPGGHQTPWIAATILGGGLAPVEVSPVVTNKPTNELTR